MLHSLTLSVFFWALSYVHQSFITVKLSSALADTFSCCLLPLPSPFCSLQPLALPLFASVIIALHCTACVYPTAAHADHHWQVSG